MYLILIKKIAKHIHQREPTPTEIAAVVLYFNGEMLATPEKLIYTTTLKEGSVLQIRDINSASVSGSYHITVRTLTGKVLELHIPENTTGDKLREIIQDKEGIPPDQQRLIFGGRELPVSSLEADFNFLSLGSNITSHISGDSYYVYIPTLFVGKTASKNDYFDCFFSEDGSMYTKVREIPAHWLQLSVAEASTIQAAASAAKLKLYSSNTIPENHVLAFSTITHCGSPTTEMINWDNLYLFTVAAQNFTNKEGVSKYLGFSHPLYLNNNGTAVLSSYGVGQDSTIHLVLKLRGD